MDRGGKLENANQGVLLDRSYLKAYGTDFEISVHAMPKSLTREVRHVFPQVELTNLLLLPTLQRSKYDLVTWGGDIDVEKDRLLGEFFNFAKPFCAQIAAFGYWADYIDPCSGLPMITPDCNKVFNEVDCMECVLGYKTMNCGCCKVLLHPIWGSSVYPASVLTTAPSDVIERVLKEYIS